MRVGILSESDADETGIRVLVEAVLQHPVEVIKPVRIRARGWGAVVAGLPARYRALHWQPDVDGFIVVIDSDETPVHDLTHEQAGFSDPACRCCELYRIISRLQQNEPPRP